MWEIDYQYSKSIPRQMERLQDRSNPHPLGCLTVKQGMILPYRRDRSMTYGLGGVLDASGRFVRESAFYLPFTVDERPDFGGAYLWDGEMLQHREERVIYAGFINNNEWGHFLVDWSVRLWYAVERDRESPIVFCQRGSEKLHGNILRTLELAGIPEDRLLLIREGDGAVSFSEILIPEPSLSPKGYTEEFRLLFEAASAGLEARKPKLPVYEKIYMTRTGLSPKKDFGEEELEAFYESNGFQVLRPEQLTIDEQIHYMRHCREAASLEGSAAHNMVFADRCFTQTILEKTQAVNIRQMILNQCWETRVTYVGTYPRFKFYDYYSDGPFLVGITRDFVSFAKSRGLSVQRKRSVWLRNYLRYFFTRAGRRIRGLFEKAGRVMRRRSNGIRT